jgi:hypothetical protein
LWTQTRYWWVMAISNCSTLPGLISLGVWSGWAMRQFKPLCKLGCVYESKLTELDHDGIWVMIDSWILLHSQLFESVVKLMCTCWYLELHVILQCVKMFMGKSMLALT